MKRIEDITLVKLLSSGSFGEVYLSTIIGKKGYFATKKLDRLEFDHPSRNKYFETELFILKTLNHPNIVKLVDVKATKDHYYIVQEFINGGDLDKCLEKYKSKNGRPFSIEIVQFLMRQIVDAVKYIHSKNIIHRDIKAQNIMLNFDNESDKANLNMMRAKVKLIDFGFSCIITKGLAYTTVGNPGGMSPNILKAHKNGEPYTEGYDEKADIWSLGSLCYELLFGHNVFNATSVDDLAKKVENGTFYLPINISNEVVSFFNAMLQYEPDKRYSAAELANHPFLTKRVQDFQKIDLNQVSNKVHNGNLAINIKKNETICRIFNNIELMKKTVKQKNQMNTSMRPINESMALNRGNYQNFIPPGGKNIYGNSMFPNGSNQMNMIPANNNNVIRRPNTFNCPVSNPLTSNYFNKSNIFPANNIPYNRQVSQNINHSNYIPANNHIVNEDEEDSGCNIY